MKLHAILAAILSSAPVAGQPEDRRAIVASVDPALLAGPAPLAAPLIFAHGNLGIPRVITWANTAGTSGIAWGTTAAITAANAYVTYDGTNLVFNAPTSRGFSFTVNGVQQSSIDSAGFISTNNISILSGTTLTINDAQGNAGPVFTDAGTTIATALDGALTVAGVSTFNAETVIDGTADVIQLRVQGFSTQTTLPFVVENSAGTDQFTVSNAGAVVALGTGTWTGDMTLNGGTDALVFGASAQEIRTVDGVLSVAGGLSLTGATDTVQLLVTGNATQTALLLVVENSAGTDQFTVSNAGLVNMQGALFGPTSFQIYSENNGSVSIGQQSAPSAFAFRPLTYVLETTTGNLGTSFGTGTVVSTVGGTLNVNTTAVGNVDGGADVLISYTLPASSLVTTGRGIRVHAYGSFANNANAKTLTCEVGTQVVSTHSPTVSVAGELWEVDYTFIRTALSAQDWKAVYEGNTGTAGAFDYDPEAGTAIQTETGTLAISCTGTGVATNDIVMEGQIVTAF